MEGCWFYRYRIRNWCQRPRKTESTGTVAHSLQSYLVGGSETSGASMRVGDLVIRKFDARIPQPLGIVMRIRYIDDLALIRYNDGREETEEIENLEVLCK